MPSAGSSLIISADKNTDSRTASGGCTTAGLDCGVLATSKTKAAAGETGSYWCRSV
jgi:hypothetical protein